MLLAQQVDKFEIDTLINLCLFVSMGEKNRYKSELDFNLLIEFQIFIDKRNIITNINKNFKHIPKESIMSIKLIIILVSVLVSVVIQAWPQNERRELTCGESAKLGLFDKLFDRPIKQEQFPYLADISIRRGGNSVPVSCSGVLISQDSVLSSLKCFRKKNYINTTIQVQFGSSMKVFKVKKIYYSKNPSLNQNCGNETISNGLALVKLAEPVTYSLSGKIIANRACLKLEDNFTESPHSLIALSTRYYTTKPESGNNKVKYAVPLKTFRCENEPSSYRLCGINKRNPNLPLRLTEGTPIVKTSKNQIWTVVGIHIGEQPLWGNCKEDSSKNYARFLTFDGEREHKFLNDYLNEALDAELY